MSERESKFGVGDTARHRLCREEGVIVERHAEPPGPEWKVEWHMCDGVFSGTVWERSLELIRKADPVALPGGDDCCNKPLPDFFGEAGAPEPAPPDGYDRELLEIQLASVHRALSVAHAGLIATPVETVAPTLALGMAMESIESLIRDVRGE